LHVAHKAAIRVDRRERRKVSCGKCCSAAEMIPGPSLSQRPSSAMAAKPTAMSGTTHTREDGDVLSPSRDRSGCGPSRLDRHRRLPHPRRVAGGDPEALKKVATIWTAAAGVISGDAMLLPEGSRSSAASSRVPHGPSRSGRAVDLLVDPLQPGVLAHLAKGGEPRQGRMRNPPDPRCGSFRGLGR
jgi:hypothetical protein